MKEANQTEERYAFLEKEGEDLEKAHADLDRLLKELREKIHVEFAVALKKINKEFATFFGLMFGGGEARLKLVKKEIGSMKQGEETEGEQEEVDVKKSKAKVLVEDDYDETQAGV